MLNRARRGKGLNLEGNNTKNENISVGSRAAAGNEKRTNRKKRRTETPKGPGEKGSQQGHGCNGSKHEKRRVGGICSPRKAGAGRP